MPVSPNEAFLRLVWTHGLYTRLDPPGIEVIDPGSAGPEDGIDAVNARIALEGTEISGPIAIHERASDWRKHLHHIDSKYDRCHPACRGVRRRGRLPDGRIGRAYRHDELPPRTARAVSRPARGKRILPMRPDAGANAGSQAVRTADRVDGRASRTKVQRLSEPLPRNGQRLERNVLRHAVPHDGRRIEPRALHEAGANGTLYGPVQSARVRRVGRGPAAGRRRPIAADRVSRPLHGHATAGIPPFVPSVRDRADAP